MLGGIQNKKSSESVLPNPIWLLENSYNRREIFETSFCKIMYVREVEKGIAKKINFPALEIREYAWFHL